MKVEIKSWMTGAVLFEGDFSCIAEAVKAAISKKANLGSANLGSADLRSADLGSANLRSANLSYANLGSADLRYANLSSADLRSANLGSANLGSADLRSADLGSANLRSANLSSADLGSADLRYADLGSANLGSADLRSANLGSADLGSADLRSADLRYANLGSADLRYANLRSANLSYAKNAEWAIAMTRILPEGDIIGWKKCNGGAIVKLLIPAKAERSHALGRKCRAEFAEVLEIWNGDKKVKEATSNRCGVYVVGKTVKPDSWDKDFTNECSHGIHFFITRLEAEHYEP